jgi:hypothetical protein
MDVKVGGLQDLLQVLGDPFHANDVAGEAPERRPGCTCGAGTLLFNAGFACKVGRLVALMFWIFVGVHRGIVEGRPEGVHWKIRNFS